MCDQTQANPAGENAISVGWLARTVILFLIMAVFAVVQVAAINDEIDDGMRGWSISYYDNIGRNLVLVDIERTRGAMVTNSYPREDEELRPYINHPPMTGWIAAAAIHFLGHKESSMRLPAMLASLASILLLYLIAVRLFNPWLGLGAALIFAFLPMNIHFGSFLDVQGPILLCCCLLIVLQYLRFCDRPSVANFVLLAVLFFVGTLIDWPAYYLAAVLPLHYRLSKGRWNGKILLLPVVAVGAFVVFLLHANLALTGQVGLGLNRMWMAFHYRIGLIDHGNQGFTVLQWLDRVFVEYMIVFFTVPALALTGVWCARCVAAAARRRATEADWLFLALLVFGLLHVAIFFQGAYTHEFWAIYTMPAVAIGTVMCVFHFGKKIPLGGRVWPAAVLCIVAICGVLALSGLSAKDLAAKTTHNYAVVMKDIGSHLKPDAVLLSEIPVHETQFYMRGKMESALFAPVNFQIMQQAHEDTFMLICRERDSAQLREIVEIAEKDNALAATFAFYLMLRKNDLFLGHLVAGLPPAPKITNVVHDGANTVISWEPAQGTDVGVKGYIVYLMQPGEKYFSGREEIGDVTTHEVDNSLHFARRCCIVAIYENGYESGFEQIIDLPD